MCTFPNHLQIEKLKLTYMAGRKLFLTKDTLEKSNRPFSKMATETSNKSKLKTYSSTRKNTFTLVNLQSFSISGVISAEKM